jgi:ankyrin repeat protein
MTVNGLKKGYTTKLEASATLWTTCMQGSRTFSNANVMIVKAALDVGADVNFSNQGLTCLGSATLRGDHEIVEVLLGSGADKDATMKDGCTALHIAAETGKGECIVLLLNAGADTEVRTTDSDSTALTLAAQHDHCECLQLLLDAGADKDATTGLGDMALMASVHNNHVKSLELLLDTCCEVNTINTNDFSALCYAVQKGHIECARSLVRASADVNIKFKGRSLYTLADYTTNSAALKTALRLPADKRRYCCEQCGTRTPVKTKKCSKCKTTAPASTTTTTATVATTAVGALPKPVPLSFKCAMKSAAAKYNKNEASSASTTTTTTTTTAAATAAAAAEISVAKDDACASCTQALPEKNRLRCGRCKAVYYCSQACQRSDWKGDHKQTCKAPSAVVASAPAAAKDDKCRQNEQTCDVPVVAAPAAAKKEYCCVQCDTTTSDRKKMQACSVCKTAYYCNRACQVAHWELHKPVCKAKPVE